MILISAFGLMGTMAFGQNGTCGANLTWTLKDSTLTISGTGNMDNFFDDYRVNDIPWYEFNNKIAKVVIESGVTSIGRYAFMGCKNLISISIPNSVTIINGAAFYDCRSLTSVSIPESVTRIEYQAFYNCSSLTSIPIPNSVTNIRNSAFYGCSALTSIIIPKGVTKIEFSTFRGCRNLISITIPESVTSIEYEAFSGCSSLTSITIPSSVTSIGNNAFNGCSGLTSITIPNGVTYIGSGTFSGCSNLTSITIPESVTNIQSQAFLNCSNLSSISLPENISHVEVNAFDGTAWYNNQPDGVVYIGKFLYKYKGIMPPNTTINILDDTKTINYSAFEGCSGLSSINIPASVINLNFAWSDFQSCNNLTAINVDANNTAYVSENGVLFNKDKTTLLQYPQKKTGTSYVIPNTVTTIASEAFYNCSALTSITIPNSVTNIGSSAFYNCTPAEVSIPDMSSSFTPLLTSSLRKLTLTNIGTITTSTLNSVTTNLTELNLPNTLTSIANGSLSRFTNLASLSVPFIGTSPANPAELGVLFGGANSTVPASLKKLTIVRSSTDIRIANSALSGCTNLNVLILSSNVKGLGENALYGCNGLTDIYSQWAYPPTAYNNSTFQGVNKFSCKVHVPVGSKQYYSVADGWKEFFSPVDNIQEEAAVVITVHSVPTHGGIINGALQYNYDETAKLTAIGNMGYDFQGWMENNQIVSANREYTFMVEGARTLYAIFTPRENANKDIQIQAQGNSATISWVAVEDAANYTLIIYSDDKRTQEITRFQLDANGKILRSTNLSYTISDLEQETTYYYSLTSYDAANNALTISNGNFKTTDGTVEIENVFVDNQLKIYPNPTTGLLTISGATSPQNIEIYDNTGRLVLLPSCGGAGGGFNISHLPNGIYFIQINGKRVKVVKQ